MLSFKSASVRIANTGRAVDECLELAFEGEAPDSGVYIVNASMGHKLERIAEALRERVPEAQILATSCGGVVGREGAGEAMTHMAMMCVRGPEDELACAAVDGVIRSDSYEKGLELARSLQSKLDGISIIYLVCPGLGAAVDLVLKAFAEVFGDEVVIFGGVSADNYKGIATYQYIGDGVTEHGAWAVGFADSTLKCATKATHGFTAYGDPMVVTEADGNHVVAIDGMPAWQAYAGRLSLIPENDVTLTIITAGGLAEELPPALAEEYGNTHILRGALMGTSTGVMYLSVTVEEGSKFWLTTRDENLIFSEQAKALEYLSGELRGSKPVAVLQTDCLARGRTLFNRVMKDELIGMMQSSLMAGDDIPPWLGMYGFGEFCPLGGKNTFHTYTTSLMVLYR